MELISQTMCFGGSIEVFSHRSTTCNAPMKFSIYLPEQVKERSLPVLYFLSGLTCTEENFMAKAGAQQFAAKHGLILVAPDTSPRNTGIAGEDDDWDFGTGAGFYVDATANPWSQHYRMYSYIVDELPEFVRSNFPVSDRQSIMGHSMGGHGALVCALRNPDRYQSVSAFAPICAPMQCAWGEKAFSNYLGANRDEWRSYDASELVQIKQFPRSILIDQGSEDKFLSNQLLPDVFRSACEAVGQPLNLRLQTGYDHSYYFIASFIEEHIQFHASNLY